MDLRQLRYFVAIVEHGSFSKAALALHVAQPALSLHVRNMEADFGASLLFRSPQGVRPTEAGEILARDARLILRQLEATRQEIKGHEAEPQGDVSIGLPSALTRVLGVRLLMESKRLYPKLRLNIAEAMSGFILDWLRRGRVDIGLLYEPIEDQKLTSSHVLSEDLMLMGLDEPPEGCPSIDTEHICLDHLARLPLILGKSGHGMRDRLEAKLAEAGSRLNVVFETESFACIGPMVEQRLGYSLVTASTFDPGPAGCRFRTWTIGTPKLRVSTYAVHGTDRPMTGAMTAVLSLCSATLAALQPKAACDPI